MKTFLTFKLAGKISASGNIMSLINFGELTSYCFNQLFGHSISSYRGLITPPDLPATNLADHCYDGMFLGCTNLTTPPYLPATNLADYCYTSMFQGCTSLTTAPELPATELAQGCYYYMFRDCTNLTIAPDLPATNLADYCYGGMFSRCSGINSIKLSYTGNFDTKFMKWVTGVNSQGILYYNGSDTTRGENGIPTNFEVQTFTP